MGMTPFSPVLTLLQVPPVTVLYIFPETVVFLIPLSAFNALVPLAKLARLVVVFLSANHQLPVIAGIVDTICSFDTTDKPSNSPLEIKPTLFPVKLDGLIYQNWSHLSMHSPVLLPL